MKRHGRNIAAIAACVGLLVATSACNGDGNASDDPPETETTSSDPTSAPPTSTPPATPKEKAIAEAKQLITDWTTYKAGLMEDPKKADFSGLDEYLVKPELTAQENYLKSFRDQGFYTNGKAQRFEWMKVTHSKLTPAKKQATVSITACYDLAGGVAYDKDGNEAAPNVINPGIATYEIWNYSYPNADGWRIGIETIPGKECKR